MGSEMCIRDSTHTHTHAHAHTHAHTHTLTRKHTHTHAHTHTVNAAVTAEGDSSIRNLAQAHAAGRDIDILSIDVDGLDFELLSSLKTYPDFRPAIIVAECNAFIRPDLDVQLPQGSPLAVSCLPFFSARTNSQIQRNRERSGGPRSFQQRQQRMRCWLSEPTCRVHRWGANLASRLRGTPMTGRGVVGSSRACPIASSGSTVASPSRLPLLSWQSS